MTSDDRITVIPVTVPMPVDLCPGSKQTADVQMDEHGPADLDDLLGFDCPVCGRGVGLRLDGTLKAHQRPAG